jgi:hypothetical protein
MSKRPTISKSLAQISTESGSVAAACTGRNFRLGHDTPETRNKMFCMPLKQGDAMQNENPPPSGTGGRLSLQIFLGIFCSVVVAYVFLYLGLFWESQSPDGNSYILTWRSALVFALIVGATQWTSLVMFRRRIALPVFAGLLLFMALTVLQLNSNAAFFWERHSPEGTFSVGLRSDMLCVLLFAATQGISFLFFRRFRRGRPASV